VVQRVANRSGLACFCDCGITVKALFFNAVQRKLCTLRKFYLRKNVCHTVKLAKIKPKRFHLFGVQGMQTTKNGVLLLLCVFERQFLPFRKQEKGKITEKVSTHILHHPASYEVTKF